MPVIARKRRPVVPLQHSTARQRELAHIERCGTCQELWRSDQMTTEDGLRVCPNDVDVTTETYKSAILEREAARADLYNIEPNVSQATMSPTIPATVGYLVDAAGDLVYMSAPLELLRTVAATLTLHGRGFVSTDTITLPSGITNSMAPVITSTTITLQLIADIGVTAGVYSFSLNGNPIRNVLQVR